MNRVPPVISQPFYVSCFASLLHYQQNILASLWPYRRGGGGGACSLVPYQVCEWYRPLVDNLSLFLCTRVRAGRISSSISTCGAWRSYELVQVQRRKLWNSLPHEWMPLALSTRVSHYIVSYRPPMNKEGDMASYIFQDLGLALVKSCPHGPQAIKKGNNGQAFPWENSICFGLFSQRDCCRYSEACLWKSHANSRRLDCVGQISSHTHLTPKVDPYWNFR